MKKLLSLLTTFALLPCASGALITTGLVLRLDGSDVDGDGNTDVGTGSVSTWVDKSGQGNDVSAAVAADEPSTVANFNGSGLNAVNFNGDLLSRNDDLGFTGNPAATVFIVTNATTNGRMLQFGVSGAGSAGRNYAFRSDSSWRFNNGNRIFAGAGALNGNGPSIGIFRSAANANYGAKEFYLNGSTPATPTGGGGATNVDFTGTLRHTVVGVGWTGNNSFNAKNEPYNNSPIAEILVYNRELSLAEVEEVGFFLQEKWDIGSTFVPEPGSAVLALLGGSLLLRRRRK